jgi:c-di-GMP-binding flagellar brake protein YcgR
MGVSSQPRKNPYVTQGLLPGTTLHIAAPSAGEEQELVTRVEGVSEDHIAVLPPMRKRELSPLTAGELLRASYVHHERRFQFVTEVLGGTPDGTLQYLQAPGLIEEFERRETFRLETSIRPISLYRIVVDRTRADEDNGELAGVVVDLGEGGLRLSSPAVVRDRERLGIHASLGEDGEFMARMQVTDVTGPASGQRNYRIHCRFTDISQSDADRIARYLMRRQLEMRRRGQL